jgi:YlmC/YmxH family sporulation protein
MSLAELQTKEVIDISTGRRVGAIIDVIIDKKGSIQKILLEDRKPSRKLFSNNKEDIYILWSQIIKIGDDIILIDREEKHN